MDGTVLPVKIQPGLLRPLAYRVLSKKYGLNIKSDGLVELANFIGGRFGIDWKRNTETIQFLEKFAFTWEQQERGLFVDKVGVESILRELKEQAKTSELAKDAGRAAEREAGRELKSQTLDRFILKKDNSMSNAATNSASESPSEPPSEAPTAKGALEVADEPQTTLRNISSELSWQDYFKVINAYEQQKFIYNYSTRQYRYVPPAPKLTSKTGSCSLQLKIPNITAKISLHASRYHIVKDRTMRNESFQKDSEVNALSSVSNFNATDRSLASQETQPISLTQIKNLLGRNGRNFCLLGILKKNHKGNWALEDPSGSVELEMTQAIPTKGTYYVAGCFVLVEGIYFSAGHKFHVTSMAHPPGERRENTLEAVGNIDFLGVHQLSKNSYTSRLDRDLKIRLHFLEQELTDHRFIFLGGDCFLDQMNTLDALRNVFKKLELDPPTVLVFQGSFSSVPVTPSASSRAVSATSAYENGFDSLASLLSNFTRIINETTFIFIPGQNDPWSSSVDLGVAGMIPQKPVPTNLVKRMRVCKKIIWASNPTRIAYLSREIVIMRDDINGRFKRHSVVFPFEESKLQEMRSNGSGNSNGSNLLSQDNLASLPARVVESRKIVKTILDQGHLSPFDTSNRPVVWDLDNTLQLAPIPSTLVLSDTTASTFDVTYNGCKSLNVGSFLHKRRARYVEYTPSLRKAVPEEETF
ncbi:LAMI_0E04940g1_1 [Lachancea mirantina]|uniref:DNA polymerase epsilon subunit B n=1 Tax=Lachancea mirantina TaxID=1230905 RepID=A0A1G4JKS9_9SACH|nr:LAMI_0E04940g1_1 [Lachancea mirantina]